ncbi:MAG: SpoIIE family protein phosphatase [Snowella sp.]|nr:SpoIIE family protein phosphatase [Snowella sp.]
MVQLLIIDDDPAMQRWLQRILKNSGYSVSVASNGEEGLIQAKEQHPALIICDWLMPKITGLDVCRQIKSLPELSTTFFILLTSLSSIEDRVQGLDAGADDFLFKPIQISELLARVRAGLRLHNLSQDLKEQKQLLETELREAADYVRSILPEPLTHEKLAIDVRFFPCQDLGGDGFDYFWLDETHLAIYLLDVAGHGLRAALPSISVINLLRSQKLNQVNYYQPSNVLQELNQVFQITSRNDKYFTIWYGVYNCQTRELIYASAGHPPAILLEKNLENQQNSLEKELKTPGFPIGMFANAQYSDKSCIIPPQASLYIFSDGIYEVEKINGYYLGLQNFIPLLKEYQANTPQNLDQLFVSLKAFHHKSALTDDLSIIEAYFP